MMMMMMINDDDDDDDDDDDITWYIFNDIVQHDPSEATKHIHHRLASTAEKKVKVYVEDLTRVVISHEIFLTSLW